MVGGPTESDDLDQTESNRAVVRSFAEAVLISRQLDRLEDYVTEDGYAEHNRQLADGALRSALEAWHEGGRHIDYQRVHRSLAEGNIVLCVNERHSGGVRSAFYDLSSCRWKARGTFGTQRRRSHLATNGRTTTASSDTQS